MTESTISSRIEDALATGPMTRAELEREFGPSTRGVLNWMHRGRKEPLIHVCGWRRDNEYGRTYLRALYALGSKRDAPKPPPLNNTEKSRRWRQGKRTRVTSVFELGVPVKQRQVLRRPGVASTLCGSLPSSTQCASAQSTAPST